ncbi:sigma-54 dependent transcriptional regulator [Cobetia sp. 5-25-4-2]|uniref:sigma-54-dependent transcriptional regulator n=1 Tax=Cobetia sp. 5-25-4-2 TaxID=2737459 RepID=UPI00159679B5|nr:response regulator [Cobetia sp. 5-25-4-2]
MSDAAFETGDERLTQDHELTREAPIWLVDDDPAVRESLSQWLELADLNLRCFPRAEALLEALAAGEPVSVVISDIRMPGMDGLTLLSRLTLEAPELPVLMMTGHGDVATAVSAMQGGARDFIEKPFDPEALELKLRQALAGRRLSDENQRLRRRLSVRGLAGLLRGESAKIRQLREQILELKGHPARVWITGESGSGRTTTALALAEHAPAEGEAQRVGTSPASALLAKVECRALVGMASSGAVLSEAIDEALQAAPEMNTLLLHGVDVLSREQWQWLDAWLNAQPEGGRRAPRVVFSAECSVQALVASGTLGLTRGHALAEIELVTPSLRERREDIPLLMAHFSRQAADVHQVPDLPFVRGELTTLMAADWPGNLAQLRQLASQRTVLGEQGQEPPATGQEAGEEDPDGLAAQVALFEATLIRAALTRARGNIAQVLEELALPRRTLNLKMHKYGLRRDDFRHGADGASE